MSDIVYILTNPAMPDLVKIGHTDDIARRLKELSRPTGVPIAFECFYCCTVTDGKEVEDRLKEGLAPHRFNPKKEFFRYSPHRVKALLEIGAIEDVTPRADDYIESQEEKDALDKARSIRPVFTFPMINIPQGAQLKFSGDESKVARVVDDRKVEFEGEQYFLSRITKKLLQDQGKNWSTVRGPDHWLFENETLTDRRLKIEEEENESE